MRIAVTGSSGLIGTALVAALRGDGHQVTRLVRGGPAGDDTLAWDPRADGGGLDPRSLGGVAAVVHLAGAGGAGRRGAGSLKGGVRGERACVTPGLRLPAARRDPAAPR